MECEMCTFPNPPAAESCGMCSFPLALTTTPPRGAPSAPRSGGAPSFSPAPHAWALPSQLADAGGASTIAPRPWEVEGVPPPPAHWRWRTARASAATPPPAPPAASSQSGTRDPTTTLHEPPVLPSPAASFGGSLVSHRIYVSGFSPTTPPEALGEHINAAFSRALRPGVYVQAVFPLPGGKAAMVVFTSGPSAAAALQLDDALLCDGARLALKRPQGWRPSPADELVAPLVLRVVREEEGVEPPPPHVLEARLVRQREAAARPKPTPTAATAAARAPRPARTLAPTPVAVPPPAPAPIVLDRAQVALVTLLRATLSRKAVACLEALCARQSPSNANGKAIMTPGVHKGEVLSTSVDVFITDVAELFEALHAHGVRILVTGSKVGSHVASMKVKLESLQVKGLQVTIEKQGGGRVGAHASYHIPGGPTRNGVQMSAVHWLRDALREVGFPCEAFA